MIISSSCKTYMRSRDATNKETILVNELKVSNCRKDYIIRNKSRICIDVAGKTFKGKVVEIKDNSVLFKNGSMASLNNPDLVQKIKVRRVPLWPVFFTYGTWGVVYLYTTKVAYNKQSTLPIYKNQSFEIVKTEYVYYRKEVITGRVKNKFEKCK